MVIHGASSQKFNSLKRQIKFLDATCCASRAYQSLNSSKSLATLVSITLPIHFIHTSYQCYAFRGNLKGFPTWMVTVCFSSHKAAVWSTAVLPTWLFYRLTATDHCHYNDGKCHLVVHNPQKLCTDCRNSPRWKFKTSLLLGHELNYSAVPAEVSSCREMKASLNVELLLI